MRSKNASMFRLLLGATVGLTAVGGYGKAYAADKNPAPAPSAAAPAPAPGKSGAGPAQKDEKVDISDLENKYWAPKDTDFSVVQNRTYTKEKRFFISLGYGIPTSDAYNDGSFIGLTGNYFFTERHGIQLSYLKANLHPSEAIKDLANFGGSGVYADHGQMANYMGLAYNFVPFYSKMSFMGKKIIYFDMAVSPTLGMTTYEQIKKNGNSSQSAFTYGLDITQYFFFSNHFAVRMDWKNQWYPQQVVKYQNSNGPPAQKEGDSAATKSIHDSILMLGVTFFF